MEKKQGLMAVFLRECKRIFSSKICIFGLLVVPVVSALILMSMMDSGLPNKIPIAVVDYDNSSTSRSLIRTLDAFPKTDIKFKSLSFNEARKRMERMEVYAVLIIPKDFSKDAISGNQPKITYYTNNAFLISGSLLFQDLKTISTLASGSVGLKMGEARGYTKGQIMPVIQPIQIESHPLSNPSLNYSLYLNNILLPTLLQLIIFLFTVSSLGAEVKSGTGNDLYRLSGNSIWKTMLGKQLPYTIIYVTIALMYMSILYYINKFPLQSGFLPMFINYLFMILASQGVGIILFAVFRNYRFTLSAASLIGVLSFSMVGLSFPVQGMNSMLHALSYIFPMRHFFIIYINQALNGIDIGYSMYYYAALLLFVLISFCTFGIIKNILLKDTYKP